MEAAADPGVRSSLSGLTAPEIDQAIAAAGLDGLPDGAAGKLAEYLNLQMRWNRVTNLTSLRDSGRVLGRHIIESVAAAQLIPGEVSTLLDFGSGAGLPGIPIAICRPEIGVTLAEAHGKKAAFLREAARSLDLGCSIFAGRAETMDSGARFDVVTLRAVEKIEEAVRPARGLLRDGGWLVLFTTNATEKAILSAAGGEVFARRGLETGEIVVVGVPNVPRGARRLFHVEH